MIKIKKFLSVSFFRDTVLVISVYSIWVMILGEFLSGYGNDEVLYAFPATILSIWIYKDQARSKQ